MNVTVRDVTGPPISGVIASSKRAQLIVNNCTTVYMLLLTID